MSGKLIFVDVDDTLFDKPSLSVPDSARKGLQKAQANGHKIFINTGRPYSYIEDELKDIGFDGILCSNGLDLHIDGKTVFHQALPEEARLQLRDLALKYNVTGSLQGCDCVYFRDKDASFHSYYATLLHDFARNPQMPHVHSWDNIGAFEKGIFFAGNNSDMPGFVAAVDALDYEFNCLRIDDTQYEILQKGYDKGTALLYAADYYHKTATDCYAFGDSNNDAEMLQTAGYGIAMGNSCEELKELADYVTTDITEDGIYNALMHFKLI